MAASNVGGKTEDISLMSAYFWNIVSMAIFQYLLIYWIIDWILYYDDIIVLLSIYMYSTCSLHCIVQSLTWTVHVYMLQIMAYLALYVHVYNVFLFNDCSLMIFGKHNCIWTLRTVRKCNVLWKGTIAYAQVILGYWPFHSSIPFIHSIHQFNLHSCLVVV